MLPNHTSEMWRSGHALKRPPTAVLLFMEPAVGRSGVVSAGLVPRRASLQRQSFLPVAIHTPNGGPDNGLRMLAKAET